MREDFGDPCDTYCCANLHLMFEYSSPLFFIFKIFFNLNGGLYTKGIEREGHPSTGLLPRKSAVATVELIQIWELGVSSSSPTLVQGPNVLGPFSVAFLGHK